MRVHFVVLKNCKIRLVLPTLIDINIIVMSQTTTILTLTPDKVMRCNFEQLETINFTWSALRFSQPDRLRPVNSLQFFTILSNITGTLENVQFAATKTNGILITHF